MKSFVSVFLAFLATTTFGAPNPTNSVSGAKARLSQVVIDAPLPRNATDAARPMNWARPGYTLTYCVKQEGIVEFVPNSLKLTSLTVAGTDISTRQDGTQTWSFGGFPKVEGGFGSFSIEITPDEKQIKATVPIAHGTVETVKSTGTIAKEVSLIVDAKQPVTVEGVSFTIVKKETDEEDHSISIRLVAEGDIEKIGTFELLAGDEVLEPGSNWVFNGKKTVSFWAPETDAFILKATFHKETIRQTVAF